MANFLIPHTFVAGTKAKAEEVNANFSAVKTALDSKALQTGDSATKFAVADATEAFHAVSKSQFDDAVTTLNADMANKNKLIPFCAVSGNVNSEGQADLLSFELLEVSFNVGGTYPNLVISSVDECCYELSEVNTINMSGSADGVYNVFVSSSGTAYAKANKIYVQKTSPTLLVDDVWLDISKEPVKAYSYNGTENIAFNDVPVGTINVSEGAITEVATNPYNQNKYNLNVSYLYEDEDYHNAIVTWNTPDYANGVDLDLTTTYYTVPYDAEIVIYAYTFNADMNLYLNGEIVRKWNVSGSYASPHSMVVRVKKGDIIRLNRSPAYGNYYKMYKLREAN